MMYIFEAIYTNLETEERIVRKIGYEYETDPTGISYREAFEGALINAFEMQEENEELYEIRNIAC